jgi:hypothetical protein
VRSAILLLGLVACTGNVADRLGDVVSDPLAVVAPPACWARLTGRYLVTYVDESGDCGPLGPFAQGVDPAEDPSCAATSSPTADIAACSGSYAVSCDHAEGRVLETATFAASQDGSSVSGELAIQLVGKCAGVYSFSGVRS